MTTAFDDQWVWGKQSYSAGSVTSPRDAITFDPVTVMLHPYGNQRPTGEDSVGHRLGALRRSLEFMKEVSDEDNGILNACGMRTSERDLPEDQRQALNWLYKTGQNDHVAEGESVEVRVSIDSSGG